MRESKFICKLLVKIGDKISINISTSYFLVIQIQDFLISEIKNNYKT